MEQEVYEAHAQLERDQWWFVARRAIVREVLERHLPPVPERTILDVGCGTGGMLPLLAEFGTVCGLEPEALAVDHCRASFPSFDVRQASIPEGVPGNEEFDVVTAFDVIEHIDDDLDAVRSIRRALRPSGTVVITVPALAWLWSDHDVVNGHRRRYTRRRLVELVESAQLEVVHCSYFNTVLLPAVALVRVAQRVRGASVEPHSDFTMPTPSVNQLLTRAMASERRPVARFGLPTGVSLVVVGKLPG